MMKQIRTYSLHKKPTRRQLYFSAVSICVLSCIGVIAAQVINAEPIEQTAKKRPSAAVASSTTQTAPSTATKQQTTQKAAAANKPKQNEGSTTQNSAPATSQNSVPVPVPPAVNGDLYQDVQDPAAAQAAKWRQSRPNDAAKLDIIASQPKAKWFGGWSGDIKSSTDKYVGAAAQAGKIPVLVAYNIPGRDCGSYSAGGASTVDAYRTWIEGMADGIAKRTSIVILEPDALGTITCLSAADQTSRYALMSHAVSVLATAGARVYIDASHWVAPADMAKRLGRANVSSAAGFSVNVSNYMPTHEMSAYGTSLSALLNGKHFVIDTSRNGQGSNGEWCNPAGRGLGNAPKLFSSGALDGYLWIKYPGESDGTCNGGPTAGAWWPEQALGYVDRARL